MKYVLTHKNQVINGPRDYNYRSFESTLEDDLELITTLPKTKTDVTILEINADTKIYPAELISYNFDPIYEYLDGPYWNFTDIATGSYTAKPHDIEFIKSKLKSKLAANRYDKEVASTPITINSNIYTIDTSRDGRNIFIQQLTLMSATDSVNWKFPEGWLVLDKTMLGEIVTVAATYIKGCFAWEADKTVEIDACADIELLKLIDVGDKVLTNLILGGV